ncbi:MAG: roadblock/LC7 domain-containing protein [Promethearchaeota archaeon]
MDKDVLEKKLAQLMDLVPECEGLIAADKDGKVIIGQTLTEMNHDQIAKQCATIVKDSNALGQGIGKGLLKTTTIELEEGFAVLVGSSNTVLIALAGLDGKPSLSLLKRNLMSILNS